MSSITQLLDLTINIHIFDTLHTFSTMKSFLKTLVAFLAILNVVAAFTGPRLPAVSTTVSKTVASPTSLNMVFGNKKSAAAKAEEAAKAAQYWEGEWVCKDCGYIYQRVSVTSLSF